MLRRPQRDVGSAAISAPAFRPRADAESRIGKSDALVDLILVGVGGRAGRGIADFPERLNELFASVVGGELQKGFTFVVGDDVSDIPLQPVTIILFQFLFFLAKTNSAEGEEDRRKKHNHLAGKEAGAKRVVHRNPVAAKSVQVQAIHRRIP